MWTRPGWPVNPSIEATAWAAEQSRVWWSTVMEGRKWEALVKPRLIDQRVRTGASQADAGKAARGGRRCANPSSNTMVFVRACSSSNCIGDSLESWLFDWADYSAHLSLASVHVARQSWIRNRNVVFFQVGLGETEMWFNRSKSTEKKAAADGNIYERLLCSKSWWAAYRQLWKVFKAHS